MRRTLIGLAAVGTLALGACGDDDDSSASGGSSEEFCSTMNELVSATANDEADPEAAEETLSNLEPPEEIAEEWDEYVPLIVRGNDIDPQDAEAVAEYQQQLSEAGEAGQAVDSYLTEECSISEPSQDDADGDTSDPDASGSETGEEPEG